MFSGDYHSAFKGRGMSFSEVRNYQIGDDIRSIDWNVTARFNEPFIKIFDEEREMIFILMVDVSASGKFGSKDYLKSELINEIASILAYSSLQNNDKVGLLLFAEAVELYIAPKKGKKHILHIIRTLVSYEPKTLGTDVAIAMQFLSKITNRSALIFLISDFIAANFEKLLKQLTRRNDVIAVGIYDSFEEEIMDIGIVKMIDNETGKSQWIDTSDALQRKIVNDFYTGQRNQISDIFKRSNIDFTFIKTNEDYIKPLHLLFKRRKK